MHVNTIEACIEKLIDALDMNFGPEKKLGSLRSTMMTSVESDRPEGLINGDRQ